MELIRLLDRKFRMYISEAKIQVVIQDLAQRLNVDYADKKPFFIIVLNGAFLFAADLLRGIHVDMEVSFVKLSSYSGTSSTGTITELIGLQENLEGRSVIIVEDVVDTGLTIETILKSVEEKRASDIRIVTLLFKPKMYTRHYTIDYVGIEIPEVFVAGYGLDYNGAGRNLRNIYIAEEEPQ